MRRIKTIQSSFFNCLSHSSFRIQFKWIEYILIDEIMDVSLIVFQGTLIQWMRSTLSICLQTKFFIICTTATLLSDLPNSICLFYSTSMKQLALSSENRSYSIRFYWIFLNRISKIAFVRQEKNMCIVLGVLEQKALIINNKIALNFSEYIFVSFNLFFIWMNSFSVLYVCRIN